jgi:hypothetical protein
MPNGGTGVFLSLVVASFGFTSLQTTLLILPTSVIALISMLTTGWLATKYRDISLFLLIAAVIFPIIGSALLFSVESKGLRLFAVYAVSS